MRKELITIGIVMLLIPLISVATAYQNGHGHDSPDGDEEIIVDIDVRPYNGDLPNKITIGGITENSKVPILVYGGLIDVNDIDLNTLKINGVSVSLTGTTEFIGEDVIFKFNELDLTTGENPAIKSGDTQLKLSGELKTTGETFYGIDSISVQ